MSPRFHARQKYAADKKQTSQLKEFQTASNGTNRTSQHILSVLDNPLFTEPYIHREVAASPMAFLDTALARGNMNIKIACFCLSKQHEIINNSSLAYNDGSKQSGMGLKILKWLISSGTANDLGFLQHEAFNKLLIRSLVAEGYQDVVFEWVKKGCDAITPDEVLILQGRGHESKLLRRKHSRTLLNLTLALAMGVDSALDAAYLCIANASSYLDDKPYRLPILGIPTSALIDITVRSHADRPPPLVSSFEGFLRMVAGRPNRYGQAFDEAHLILLHPTHPSADPALEVLRHWNPRSWDAEFLKVTPLNAARIRNSAVQLGLGTAKFLIEKKQYDDLDFVMDYLRWNFPRELGYVKQEEELENAAAEASSIEMLDALRLA
jgi:hypothetical protein